MCGQSTPTAPPQARGPARRSVAARRRTPRPRPAASPTAPRRDRRPPTAASHRARECSPLARRQQPRQRLAGGPPEEEPRVAAPPAPEGMRRSRLLERCRAQARAPLARARRLGAPATRCTAGHRRTTTAAPPARRADREARAPHVAPPAGTDAPPRGPSRRAPTAAAPTHRRGPPPSGRPASRAPPKTAAAAW